MYKFGEIKQCPKCGNMGGEFLGVKVEELTNVNFYSEKRMNFRLQYQKESPQPVEYLKVTCMRCEYSWQEETKDR